MPQIPINRSRGLVTITQLLTLSKEFKVDRKVYRLGNFKTNWKLLSSTQRATLVKYVHEKEPRLEGVFEGEWATDWAHKRKRGADGKAKGKKMSKGQPYYKSFYGSLPVESYSSGDTEVPTEPITDPPSPGPGPTTSTTSGPQ
ncbi:hypothetical protein V8E54_014421 [Elaphomyces granulatus]